MRSAAQHLLATPSHDASGLALPGLTQEYRTRLEVFKSNVELIHQHQAANAEAPSSVQVACWLVWTCQETSDAFTDSQAACLQTDCSYLIC